MKNAKYNQCFQYKIGYWIEKVIGLQFNDQIDSWTVVVINI